MSFRKWSQWTQWNKVLYRGSTVPYGLSQSHMTHISITRLCLERLREVKLLFCLAFYRQNTKSPNFVFPHFVTINNFEYPCYAQVLDYYDTKGYAFLLLHRGIWAFQVWYINWSKLIQCKNNLYSCLSLSLPETYTRTQTHICWKSKTKPFLIGLDVDPLFVSRLSGGLWRRGNSCLSRTPVHCYGANALFSNNSFCLLNEGPIVRKCSNSRIKAWHNLQIVSLIYFILLK